MSLTVALDTNVLWDLSKYRRSQILEPSLTRSLRAFESCLKWLARTRRIRVIAPFHATAEFRNLIREDRLARLLMARSGMPAREAAKRRSDFRALPESERRAAAAEMESEIELLAGWIEFEKADKRGECFTRWVEQLLKASSLGIDDAYVFAGAIALQADCFVSSDGVFSGDVRSELRSLLMSKPTDPSASDVPDQRLLFLNHRTFGDERIALTAGQVDERDRHIVKHRTLRAELISRVFRSDLARVKSRRIGRVLNTVRGANGDDVILYHHDDAQTLRVGMTIVIAGNCMHEKLRVKRIEIAKVEVSEISSPRGELIGVGLQIEFGSWIPDSQLPRANDLVYIDEGADGHSERAQAD